MGSILTAAPPTCCYLLGGVVRADVVLSALHRRPLRRRRAGPYRLCAENGPRRAARNGPSPPERPTGNFVVWEFCGARLPLSAHASERRGDRPSRVSDRAA